MPRLIALADDAAIGLEQCCDALATHNFDPTDEESLLAGARLLRQLGNNPSFLGDLIVAELAARHRELQPSNGYGPQAILLGRPAGADCLLRANIWPGESEAMLRASSSDAFLYGVPHNHNFHFLTLGYFGPGYWSDNYELDYGAAAGFIGEAVALTHTGKYRLEPGRIQLYRADIDVHAQLPADALSVSVNILHTSPAQPWFDQYLIDPEQGTIRAILNHGASDAFIRIAVALGGAEAIDLAHRFGHTHPSDRLRLHAWDALAAIAEDDAARDALWAEAERAGSRMLAMEAKARRAELAG